MGAMTRRQAMKSVLGSGLGIALEPGAALALSTQEAGALVDGMVGEINAAINSGAPSRS